MPRKRRMISSSRIYHVISRGIERRAIFLDTEDYEKFLDILIKKQSTRPFSIYAYCLIPNHYHMLSDDKGSGISRIMSSINTSYAMYFNKKYDRVGHLFQGRFRSEAIEDEAYLLTAIKYIHNNPVSAGLAGDASQYPWSSYNAYLEPESRDPLTDSGYLLNMLAPSRGEAISRFVELSKQIDEPVFSNHLKADREELMIVEEKTKQFVERYLQERSMNLEKLKLRSNITTRNELIELLVEKSGLPLRCIGRLLDLSKSTVFRFK